MSSRVQFDYRVLVVEPDAELRALRAHALVTAGYKVSAVADADGSPQQFAPHLYDVIVLSADRAHPASLDWCRRLGRNGAQPVVVLLAQSGVVFDFVPSLVISERNEREAEEKLFAFLAARREVPLV